MARELAIVVTVDSSQAKRELAAVDQNVKTITDSSGKAGSSVQSSLKLMETSAQSASTSVLSLKDTLLNAFEHPLSAIGSLAGDIEGVLGGSVMAVTLGVATLGVALAALAVKSVEAFVTMGESILDASFKMSDTVEHVAALKSAMDVAGGSIEQASNLLFMLQKRMEGGGPEAEKVATGLAHIGLSIQDLEGLSPVEYFLKIATAFQENTDQTNRATTAFDLFGRQGRDAIPMLMKPLEELTKQWAETTRMTRDDAKAAEELGMAWRSLKESISWAWSDTGAGIVHFFEGVRTATAYTEIAVEKLIGFTPLIDKIMGDLPKVAAAHLNIAHATDALTLSESALTAIYKDLDEQLKSQMKSEDDTTKATQKLADAQQHLIDQAIEKHWAKVGDIVDRVFGADKLKTAREWTDAIATLGGTLDHLTAKDLKDLEGAMLEAIDAMARNGTLTDETSSAYAALATQAHQLAAAMGAVAAETQVVAAAMNEVLVVGTGMNASLERGAAIAAGSAQSFTGLKVAIAATADQMAAFYAATSLLNSVGTQGANNIGVPSGLGAGNFAANDRAALDTLERLGLSARPRAAGGPVSAGGAYLVGERGPELFTPDSAGSITANGGGGISFAAGAIVIHGNVDSPQRGRQLADDLASRLMTRISQQTRGTRTKR